jgi:hypothetical protein
VQDFWLSSLDVESDPCYTRGNISEKDPGILYTERKKMLTKGGNRAIITIEREVVTMNKQYQVTLLSEGNKYRPVSTIVTCEEVDLADKDAKRAVIRKGTQKICGQRYWGRRELQLYGYLKAKIREYDKEKIEQENKERYERIKEQHYQDGTWKRPKNK